MPVSGPSVTVPQNVWGWQAVLERFGTLTFKQVLEPAAEYAEQGFPSRTHRDTGRCRKRCL